jgi:hypothetical protein
MALTGISISSQAVSPSGGESSGGGTGIVCRNIKGQITQATPLDLYEVVAQGMKMKPASGNLEQDYSTLFLELRKAMADSRPVSEQDLAYLRYVTSRFVFVNRTLPATNDTGRLPNVLPQGCNLEQVIVADDVHNQFFVDREIWNALNSLEQAAFITHEYLYQIARIAADEKTSYRIRDIVGAAASVDGLENVFAGATQGQSIVCRASLEAFTGFESDVVIYDNPENPNESVLLLTRYFGFIPAFRQAYRLPAKFKRELLIQKPVDGSLKNILIVNDPAANVGGMYLGSKNLTGERFALEYSYGKPFTLTQLTEQNQSLRTQYFTNCSVWKRTY